MAGYGRKSKSGGFMGNMAKLGGSKRKLSLKSDMESSSAVHPSMKKGHKQAHKKV
jgi:hypothetical protein